MKTIPAWECIRCGHVWRRKLNKPKPKKCANFLHCASYFWDTPKIARADKSYKLPKLRDKDRVQ